MGVSNFHAHCADGSLLLWFLAPDVIAFLHVIVDVNFVPLKKLARRASCDRIVIMI